MLGLQVKVSIPAFQIFPDIQVFIPFEMRFTERRQHVGEEHLLVLFHFHPRYSLPILSSRKLLACEPERLKHCRHEWEENVIRNVASSMWVEMRPVFCKETEFDGFDGALLHCLVVRYDDTDKHAQQNQSGEQHEEDQDRICDDAPATVQRNAAWLVIEAAIRCIVRRIINTIGSIL